VLEIRPQFSAVLLFDSERGKDSGDSANNYSVDVAVMNPLLFGERLGDNRSNILLVHFTHL
jgi:hypothetical protein